MGRDVNVKLCTKPCMWRCQEILYILADSVFNAASFYIFGAAVALEIEPPATDQTIGGSISALGCFQIT